MARGDSSSNVILFLTVLSAALIISVWYIGAVRPVRYSIDAVQEDLREIDQHLVNACTVTFYNATYLSSARGFLEMNGTHLCIYDPSYGECKRLPCMIDPARVDLDGALLRVTKDGSVISLGS